MIILVVQSVSIVGAALTSFLLMWHRPGWIFAAAISVAALSECFQVGAGGIDLGVNLYIGDAAGAVLLLTGLIALLRYRKGVPRDAVPCAALLALVALNFARGIAAFGLKPAGNSARNLFMFAAPALAIMLLRPAVSLGTERVARWVGWAGCILGSIAVLRWTGVLQTPVELEDNLRQVTRALGADQAIVIGQALIAVVYLQISRRRASWWWAVAGMLGLATIVLQHRSVWVATAAGLGWLAIRTARSSGLRWSALAAGGTVAVALVVAADPNLAATLSSLVSANLSETQSEKSTWEWRVQGFAEATDRVFAGDATDMAIGPPAGWAANSTANSASTHIHDRYIDTLAYYGLIGLAILLIWLGILAKRVSQRRRLGAAERFRGDTGSTFLQALFLSEVVYLIPYFGGILQGTALGLLWLAASRHVSPPRAGYLVKVRVARLRDPEPAMR